MNKFELFLKQEKFSDPKLNDVKLKQVTVKKAMKTWVFHLEFAAVVAPESLSFFLNQLQVMFSIPEHVKKIDYIISYINSDYSQFAESYYDFIIHQAATLRSSLAIFKNYQKTFENQVYTLLIEPDGYAIEKYGPTICELFKKYGLVAKFEFKVSEELKSLASVIEEQITEQHQAVIQKEESIVSVVSQKTKFSGYSSPKAVAINEIPLNQYELDKYMNQKGDANFQIEGEISKIELRKLPNSTLLTFSVFDQYDAIVVKRFIKAPKELALVSKLKVGDSISVSGRANFDTYQNNVVINATSINQAERRVKDTRIDKAKNKRIEFHLHTKMSNMDAITSAADYIDTLEKWGHEAVAFTDHNGLYAFPEINKAAKGKKIKPIYGAELDFVDETSFKFATDVAGFDIKLKEATYIVFDIETTGLSSVRDKIIEIAAVKISGGLITESYQTFVNPNQPLSEFTKELTNITDDMVKDAPTIEEVLPQFLKFCQNSILVAQNASFDHGFIVEKMSQLELAPIDFAVIDTLNLARYYYGENLKRFGLKALAKHFKVELNSHHRAEDDAKATAEIFLQMLLDLYAKGINTYKELNLAIDYNLTYKHIFPSHITVLAANQVGYKNLFKIISDSLTTHFHNGARTLKKVVLENRKGLLIGSACDQGIVFEAALNKNDSDLEAAIEFFDYIEVQPPRAYAHLIADLGEFGEDIIKATIQKIIMFAKKQGKIVIASSNAHYLNKEDKRYRDIYIKAKAVGGGLHPLARYDVTPDQHLLTTNEMLSAFAFLGEELNEEIVIKNTHKLNQLIDKVEAFPKELYSIPDDAFKDSLGIDSIATTLEEMVYQKAHQLYGKPLHFMVKERIEKELNSIIKNEFAPIYYISHLLVKKSLDDGYLVGSRGSVGSSLVATLLEITEVNPLRPHYRCPNGDFAVFKLIDEEVFSHNISLNEQPFLPILKEVHSGYDLPNMECPCCKAQLIKDGHDIPFETFLGFDGDKVPDIDLNFSGDYQAKAHAYVRELLGEDYTFRAGTIQTVAERNAFGYVKGYLEGQNIVVRDAQIERLALGIEGVKRSTGQHPGGIVVVPKSRTIYDVTPIQYPADDVTSEWKTTHFDYHSFEDNLLKLDILGHDDPTMIKFLMDYVDLNPKEFPFSRAQDIPLDDKEVYRLFSDTRVIGIEPNDEVYGEVASYAIPEFGTPFTREMVLNTKPNTFAGLVKISGLSHGTDVWLKNAQDLVLDKTQFGKIAFDDVIGCRDDIMVQLTELGLPPLKAFEIMEFVRKGKPSTSPDKWVEYENEMKVHKVPDWYIWSASQIKYMFPKAHATAYVIMAMRIAWFKVHKPLLFYSGFFSKRAVAFDYETMVAGANAIRNKLIAYQQPNQNLKNKDENLIVTLNVAYEMTKRGFKFLPIDIEKSEATTFIMEEGGLRMPFTSLDGLGAAVAEDIVANRHIKSFTSKEDLKKRTKLNKTLFDRLEGYGTFNHLDEGSGAIDVGIFADDY